MKNIRKNTPNYGMCHVNCKMPQGLLSKIDEQVLLGRYTSRSEAIRDFARVSLYDLDEPKRDYKPDDWILFRTDKILSVELKDIMTMVEQIESEIARLKTKKNIIEQKISELKKCLGTWKSKYANKVKNEKASG